jgi:hypothetical protein
MTECDWTQTVVDVGICALFNAAVASPAAVGPLFNATCDLFVATIVPTGATQYGDLTLPTWTGYAALPVTWGAAQIVRVGKDVIQGHSVSFTLPATAVGTTIYGFALSTTAPALFSVNVFTAPYPVAYAGTLDFIPTLTNGF